MRSSMRSVLLFFFVISTLAPASDAGSPGSFTGCLRGQQNTYVLDVNDQTHYRLQGDRKQLEQFRNQIVRVTGALSRNRNLAAVTETLVVSGLQSAGGSCGTQAQTRKWNQPVSGKEGAGEDAPTVTSTATVGQVTPGAETEAGMRQNPAETAGTNSGSSTPPLSGPSQAAPPNFDEVGQTEQQANVDAAAAGRAEVANGQGLGLQGGTPESMIGAKATGANDTINPNANSGPMSVGSPSTGGSSQGGGAATASMTITDNGFQPARTTLRSGESLTLINQTGRACGLNGPAISGMLGPGQNHRHRFTKPGTYKISCGGASAEIAVH
jgi:plastocyanin